MIGVALNDHRVTARTWLWLLGIVSLTASMCVISYFETNSIFGPLLFIGLIVGSFLIVARSPKYAKHMVERTRQAATDELRREDDVLLQAVAFSQTVLFVYLNFVPSTEIIMAAKVLVPSFAVLFYVLRAWGKITDSGKYRYYSIWVFFLILLVTMVIVTHFLLDYILGPAFTGYLNIMNSYYGVILLALMQVIGETFKKRYGLARSSAPLPPAE
jgi:uncharacterized membrane protein